MSYISTLENKKQKLNKSFNKTKIKINLNKNNKTNWFYTSKNFINQIK